MFTSWILPIFIAGISLFSTQPASVNTPVILKKQAEAALFTGKAYNISESEPIGLYGIRHKRYLDSHWYWGEYGYGALFGKRSGYLEGGVWSGVDMPMAAGIMDIAILLGAGGGGGVPQGGGLMVNPVISLGYPITSDFVISLEGGYIYFMNGNISSPTIGLNGTLSFWNLYAE